MRAGAVVIPGHSLWPEFLSRLGRAHRCFGTTEQARLALSGMRDVDVDGTLKELAQRGGTCDCRIELDLEPTMLKEA
ncbi:MAG TPA: hypothetical protein VFU59_10840 [Candidatus Eisenbacteria bacterium]|nr:hypothetical protein [Candidatus Eisenbacteria bacterium]